MTDASLTATSSSPTALIRRAIRDVPDFPKPGIVFKDITPVLRDAHLFGLATLLMAEPFRRAGITHVVAIESRGFIFGAPIAQSLGAAFVPMRKPGKLPFLTEREEYDLEYGKDALEVHRDAMDNGTRALIVDDVLATGGTAGAACRLAERFGVRVVGCSFLIELAFLGGRAKLGDRQVQALVPYE
ncbi:MAG TPA: adenine phosphoribosyltransferase [Gemmatimonadaceae bacterium]|nr:adenine phosphoribosyltransferase [Gemmatimonadaceae bacterium]